MLRQELFAPGSAGEQLWEQGLVSRLLADGTKDQLRIQAARHGRSMEEEARTILPNAIESSQPGTNKPGLGSRIHAHFAQLGSVELNLPERSSLPSPERFDGEAASAT